MFVFEVSVLLYRKIHDIFIMETYLMIPVPNSSFDSIVSLCVLVISNLKSRIPVISKVRRVLHEYFYLKLQCYLLVEYVNKCAKLRRSALYSK